MEWWAFLARDSITGVVRIWMPRYIACLDSAAHVVSSFACHVSGQGAVELN